MPAESPPNPHRASIIRATRARFGQYRRSCTPHISNEAHATGHPGRNEFRSIRIGFVFRVIGAEFVVNAYRYPARRITSAAAAE